MNAKMLCHKYHGHKQIVYKKMAHNEPPHPPTTL